MLLGAQFGSCQLNKSGGFRHKWTAAGPRRSQGGRCVVATANIEQLQIVFVTTEVAPWSKVGGLGDVMAALPAALAARGHRVMTVSPLYSRYPDVRDTGVRVPVRLPDDSHQQMQRSQDVEQQVVVQQQDQRQTMHAQQEQAHGRPAGSVDTQTIQQPGGHRQHSSAEASVVRRAARVSDRGREAEPEVVARAAAVYKPAPEPHSPSRDSSSSSIVAPAVCSMDYARYHMCCSAGVYRVFVDHPLYHGGGGGAGRPWPAAIISSYTHPVAAVTGKAGPDLAAAASVLCQAALAAPMLLWGVSRGLDTGQHYQQDLSQQGLSDGQQQQHQPKQQQLEMQLLMQLLGFDNIIATAEAAVNNGSNGNSHAQVSELLAAAAQQQQAKLALHLQHPQQIVAGLAAPVLLGTGGSKVDSRWQVSDLLQPPAQLMQAAHSPAAAAADGPVLFIANDWPCGLLPLWLQTYRENAQHWQQHNLHMEWLKQQQQQLFCQVQEQQAADGDAKALVQAAVDSCSSDGPSSSGTSSCEDAGNNSDGTNPLHQLRDVFGDYAAVYINGTELGGSTAPRSQLLQELHQDWQLQQDSSGRSQRREEDSSAVAQSSYDSSSSWSAAADAWLQEVGYDPGSVYDAELCDMVSEAVSAGEVLPEQVPELTALQSQLQQALQQEQILGEAISKLRAAASGDVQEAHKVQLQTSTGDSSADRPSPPAGAAGSLQQRRGTVVQGSAAAAAHMLSHQQELSLLHGMLGRQLADSKVVFAIHNFGYQGTFEGRSSFDRLGLPQHMLSAFVAPVTQAAACASKAAARAAAAAVTAVGSQLAALAEALQRLVPGRGNSGRASSSDAGLLSSVQQALVQAKAEEILQQQTAATEQRGSVPDGPAGAAAQLPQHQYHTGSVAGGEGIQVNWMRAGVSVSDLAITVSSGYAQQLLAGSWEATGSAADSSSDPGMAALLASRKLQGILNGLDTHCWDPARDTLLPAAVRYTAETAVRGKRAAKELLQRRLALRRDPDAPLFAFVGRLTPQKGVDVILAAVPEFMRGHMAAGRGQQHQQHAAGFLQEAPVAETQSAGGSRASASPTGPSSAGSAAGQIAGEAAAPSSSPQLVLLGTGERWMEEVLSQLAAKYPGQAVGVPAFNEPLAHLILAAADVLLVPSRFEPCGLVALAGLRYGAVPIATATGGLADIVTPEVGYPLVNPGPEGDTAGFRCGVRGLIQAMEQVLQEYGSQEFAAKRAAAMAVDVSWEGPCEAWEKVLLNLVQQQRTADSSGGAAASDA